MKSAEKIKWQFFVLVFLAVVVPAQLYANDNGSGGPGSEELTAFNVTVYTEKVRFPLDGLVTPEGVPYDSGSLQGKYALVNLWASWCPYCRSEKPSMERLYRELRGGLFSEEGLVLLTVSLGEEPDLVKQYMNENQYSFPAVVDREDHLREAYAPRIPASYVLDPEGNILARINGDKEWDSEQALKVLRCLVSAAKGGKA